MMASRGAHVCISQHTMYAVAFVILQRVYEGDFVGVPAILKVRFRKKYRHPELDDKLRKARTMGVSCVHWDNSRTLFIPKIISYTQHDLELLPPVNSGFAGS